MVMCRNTVNPANNQSNSKRVSAVYRGLVVGAVLWLSACASTPPPSSPPPPPPPPPSATPPPPEQSEQSEQSQPEKFQQQQSESQAPESQSQPAGQAGSPPPPAGAAGQDKQTQAPESAAAAAPPSGTAGDPQSSPEQANSSTGGSGAPTREEREGDLNGEFQRSLGEFDERLAREQGELQTQGDEQAGAEQRRAAQDGGGSGVNDGRIGRAPAPPPPSGPAGGETPEQTSRRGPGSPGDKASLPPAPDDVPSGQNDDVVARQLREAAENEIDPELREKLWEEYRQYKRNNG